jgi:glycosyltransferase involved in cell wall biosynthesis
MTHVSVVIPTYRGEPALRELVTRLEKTLGEMGGAYEVIFVDDRSPDDSWKVLKELKQDRPWMKIVRLMKNSGQHNAILCGFTLAKGRVVVTMDDDLQNPPEEIPKLVSVIDAGCDLAIGAYENKSRKGGMKRAGGGFVDATLRRIFKLPKNFQLTSFRAARGAIVAEAAQMSSAFPYVTAMLFSHAATYQNVTVEHRDRVHGASNYNFPKSFRLSLNLLLNYSRYPLYAMAGLCLGSFLVFAGLATWAAVLALRSDVGVPGWASTVVTLAFSNAVITASLLIQFLYIARMSAQLSRSRVSYAIGEVDG